MQEKESIYRVFFFFFFFFVVVVVVVFCADRKIRPS